MCGAEPLISMNSAESVDAFYTLLETRKHLSTSRPASASPKWPAARNDHYCDQKVCRHAVLDLSSLCEPSDNDSDVQSHVMPDNAFFDSRYDTMSTRYSETGSYSPNRSCFADEYAVGNVQLNTADWDQRATRPRFGQHTPLTSHDGRDRRSSQISPKNLDSSTRALREELDNLHISSAKSYLELEERFIDLSDSYCTLSSGYDRLAEKHDGLLHIALKLCTELGVQAKVLMELNEWKMRTQKSFAEVRAQEQDPELLYYGTPHSTSTMDITTGQVELNPVTAESHASRMTADGQDPGVTGLRSSPMTPGRTHKQHVVRPRLKLRLPPRPDTEEGLVKSPGGLVPDQHASSKRVRKPTEKRKAAALQAESTGKRAKKCRK